MSLKTILQNDIKEAVKAKNTIISTTLRSLLAEINLKEIELKKKIEGLNDSEIHQAVLKEIKKRQDAIEYYKKGGREDLVQNEEEELQILNKYAPERMDEIELNTIIDDIISEIGAQTIQDVGRVMNIVMQKVGNSADGSLVNKLVREKLRSVGQ